MREEETDAVMVALSVGDVVGVTLAVCDVVLVTVVEVLWLEL